MPKRLLSRLQNLLTCPPQETYLLLRQLLARTWLEKMAPGAWPLLQLPPLPTRWKIYAEKLTPLLAAIPVGPEGTPNALTPEIIGLLNETTHAGCGVFYTPFATAKQLAQETLLAWLKRHAFVPENATQLHAGAITPTKRPAAYTALTQLTACDPACGVGGLLVPFWLELAALCHALQPEENYARLLAAIAENNLYAADINPTAIADLRLRMALTLAAHKKPLPPTHFFAMDALGGKSQPAWHTICKEVFERGGFDIYLSNPPYIGQKNHKELFARLRQNPRWQSVLTPKSDVLYLFFLLAFDLVKPSGVAALLTTAYFAQAAGAYALRKHLHERACLLRLVDFGETKLFQRAKGQHNLITIFATQSDDSIPCMCTANTPSLCQQTDLFFGPQLFLNTRPAPPTLQTALAKMASTPRTLQDVATVSNGLMTGYDKAFILTKEDKNNLQLTSKEKKKLKPFFKNSDISAYAATPTPKLYLIDFFYPNDRQTDFSRYPHLMAHLSHFKTQLLARKQNNNGIDKQLAQGKYWFGSVRRKMNFDAEKLVVPHRARKNIFAYTPGPWYASSDVYFISTPHAPLTLWYLLALLNSSPYYAWLFYKGKRKGNVLELYTAPLGQMPVPLAPPDVQKMLETLAQQIYAAKRKNLQADTKTLQYRIDQLVGTLFHFSRQEIQELTSFLAH